MTNIWAFCLQTLTVSITALLLLGIKRLLLDKLSPRWQYSIWVLLALRCLMPASIRQDVLVPMGLWLETLKSTTESSLDSVYSAVFTPISLDHVFPWIESKPNSITDWLFVLYACGAVALAVYYLISYCILQLRLRQGEAPSQAVADAMSRVCNTYQLNSCRIVAVPGLGSAFVSGIFRPILAVPTDTDVDDKVILHELLHLKHQDILQGILWAALRCLHWFNPLMHYILNRIGNDMESLCDQRVLERLEGEERRDYGTILLSMASRRYARTPGTGSISNGSRNISRRIAAIVRFKNYPRGMELVSVCIALVLAPTLLLGSATTVDSELFWPEEPSQQLSAMAAARVQRCSTVSGAIDTYAKGILKNNGLYIAVASPLSDHPQLLSQIPDNWHWDSGEGTEYINTESDYTIYDLHANSDGSYSAYLAFPVSDFEGAASEDWPTDMNGTPIIAGTLVIPLRIAQEEDSWVVTEAAPRIKAYIRYDQIEFYGEDMPWLAEQTIACKTGTITVRHRGIFRVDNQIATDSIFGWTQFNDSLLPDAMFSSGHLDCDIIYEYDPACGAAPQESAALYVWYFETAEELQAAQPGKSPPKGYYTYDSGGNYHDCHFDFNTLSNGWSGQLWASVNLGYGSSSGMTEEELLALPAGYLIQILFDGEVVEQLKIEVNEP